MGVLNTALMTGNTLYRLIHFRAKQDILVPVTRQNISENEIFILFKIFAKVIALQELLEGLAD